MSPCNYWAFNTSDCDTLISAGANIAIVSRGLMDLKVVLQADSACHTGAGFYETFIKAIGKLEVSLANVCKRPVNH